MEYCPKCGRILREDRKRKLLICTGKFSKDEKCDYEKPSKGNEGQRFVENFNKTRETVIVKDGDRAKDSTLPATKAECRKCGNMRAYYWMMQTRGADEPSTRFYRCTKCNYTWREYE